MARRKKETYYQRWLRDKKKMTIIMKKDEFEAIKKFCDENRMSYRQFFVEVAPKLLRENEALRKSLEEREAQLNAVTGKYNDLVAKYNTLREKYEKVVSEAEDLESEKAGLEAKVSALTGELTRVKADLDSTRKRLSEAEAQLKAKDEELSRAKEELTKTKEILGILLGGKVEVGVEYCEKLRPYGFALVQKGFMKKAVCTNSEGGL